MTNTTKNTDPYYKGKLITFEEGDQAIESNVELVGDGVGDKSHTIKDGDRLDTISSLYYGTAKLGWFIYKANEDILDNPFDLTTGVDLLIPSTDKLP